MPKNKISTRKNGVDTVLLDVSQTTATEEKVLKGEIFTKADGSIGTGTMEQTVENVIQGYTMSLSDDGTELNFVWGGAKKEYTVTIMAELAYYGNGTTELCFNKPTQSGEYDLFASNSGNLISVADNTTVDSYTTKASSVWIMGYGTAAWSVNGGDVQTMTPTNSDVYWESAVEIVLEKDSTIVLYGCNITGGAS